MNIICSFLLLFGAWLPSVAQAKTFDLDTVIIEASRSEESAKGLTRPVDILTQEEIKASGAKSLPELLSAKTGIYGVTYGNVKNSVVDLRGSGETAPTNVLVLVDGRKTNQVDLSGIDWAQIDPAVIDYVEIIRGAGTVLYGDNANGGVINIVTKKGSKGAHPSVTLASEFGSYQTSKQSVQVGGGTRVLDYWFNYAHNQTTGYRANSDYWSNDFNTRLTFDPTANFGIDFGQGYHLDRYQLPGALFLNNIAQFGRSGVRSTRNDDRGWTSDSHFEVTPRLNFDVGTGNGEFSLFTSERKRSNKFFSTGTPLYETFSLTNTYEFQPKLIVETPLSDVVSNKFTGGYDYFYAKSQRRSGNLGPSQDLLYATKSTHGTYALDQITFDEKWLVNGGVRGSWAEYVFDQKVQVPGKSVRTPKTQGYEGGLGYKYNPDSKVYANYTRSYRLPATDEFFQNLYDFGFGVGGGLNADLREQTGNQYELGVKDHTIPNTTLGLNLFAAQYKGEIYLDPSTFNNTNYNGRTRHYGLETEASVLVFDGLLEPSMNWTVQEAKFRGGSYAGNEIPFVPAHILNVGFKLHPAERLTTGLTFQTVGERFAISDVSNTHAKVKSSTTVDWDTRYGYKNVELWLSVRNLLNRKYYAYGAYSSSNSDIGYYPAPPTNVAAGMSVKF